MKTCDKCGGSSFYKCGRCVSCVKTASATWRDKNKEKLRKQMSEYARANPEKVAKIKSDWKKNNAEHVKALNAAWRTANPERIVYNHRNRRAWKSGSGGSISKDIVARLFLLQKGKCPCCGKRLGDDYHLDHKMPLVLGGTHTDDNMQLLRSKCNLQKNKKHPIDFMQSRGFLL